MPRDNEPLDRFKEFAGVAEARRCVVPESGVISTVRELFSKADAKLWLPDSALALLLWDSRLRGKVGGFFSDHEDPLFIIVKQTTATVSGT